MTLVLIFTLGEDVYGLEIDAIQEIVEDPHLHPVPRATGVLWGAVNFHGQILALIDLPDLLGFAGGPRDHRRVVLTPACKSLVLTVGSIRRIVALDLSSVQPPPENWAKRAIRGVAALDDIAVNLLDTDVILKQLENLYAE